jgi:hypothetical protein
VQKAWTWTNWITSSGTASSPASSNSASSPAGYATVISHPLLFLSIATELVRQSVLSLLRSFDIIVQSLLSSFDNIVQSLLSSFDIIVQLLFSSFGNIVQSLLSSFDIIVQSLLSSFDITVQSPLSSFDITVQSPLSLFDLTVQSPLSSSSGIFLVIRRTITSICSAFTGHALGARGARRRPPSGLLPRQAP